MGTISPSVFSKAVAQYNNKEDAAAEKTVRKAVELYLP